MLFHTGTREPCPICGGDCRGYPLNPYPVTYPFLPGGYEVRSPDMPDDVIVTERIFFVIQLVAAPGDQIKAEDARRWGVGPDGRMQPAVEAAGPAPVYEEPAPEPEPVSPVRSQLRRRR